jgi:hypothetical protein
VKDNNGVIQRIKTVLIMVLVGLKDEN